MCIKCVPLIWQNNIGNSTWEWIQYFFGFVGQHLCWGGDRSEGIFKLLSSFKSQPNAEFHLHQLPNFISLHISLRLRKVLESRIANCPVSSFWATLLSNYFWSNQSKPSTRFSISESGSPRTCWPQFSDMEYKLNNLVATRRRQKFEEEKRFWAGKEQDWAEGGKQIYRSMGWVGR